jgi:uncharacterized protein YceK
MKTTMMMLTLIVIISGCSTIDPKTDNAYERQNAAAAEAHQKLDRE